MQATKAAVKKVKKVIKKVQATKVKKAATIRDNAKKLSLSKKRELNEKFDISMVIQGNKSHIQSE